MENKFIARLQYLMDQKKIVQKDVADGLGMNQARVSDWFRGVVKKPHRSTLRKLSDYFGCNVDWLANGTGKPFSTADSKVVAVQPSKVTQEEQSFSKKELLVIAMEVLESDSEYKTVLANSIRAFHQALTTENDMNRVEKELKDIKKRMERMEEMLRSFGATLPEKRDTAA